jgi:hypothetical protein
MLSVSVCDGREVPIQGGVKFQLVSATDGKVVASGATDDQGVVSFDVDASSVGDVGLRLDLEGDGKTT